MKKILFMIALSVFSATPLEAERTISPNPAVDEVNECQGFITSDTYYNYNTTINSNLYVMGNATLYVYATLTLTNNAKIVLSANSKLVVDGGRIDDCILQMDSGSELVVKGNGRLVMASGHSFKAPEGAVVKINKGRIE